MDGDLKPAGGIIGAWAEEMTWPRALRPGDELEVEAGVLSTLNQHREPVQVLTMNLLVPAREAARP